MSLRESNWSTQPRNTAAVRSARFSGSISASSLPSTSASSSRTTGISASSRPLKATALPPLERGHTVGGLQDALHEHGDGQPPLHYCDCGQVLNELGAEGARDNEHLRERHLKALLLLRQLAHENEHLRAQVAEQQKNWELHVQEHTEKLRADSVADAFYKQNIESSFREAQNKLKTEMEELRKLLSQKEEEINQASRELARLKGDVLLTQEKLEETETKNAILIHKQSNLEAELTNARETLADREAECDRLRAATEAASASVGGREQEREFEVQRLSEKLAHSEKERATIESQAEYERKTAREAATRAERERLAHQKQVLELQRRVENLEADLQRERSASEALRSQMERERAASAQAAQVSASTSASASTSSAPAAVQSASGGGEKGSSGAPNPQRQLVGSATPPRFAEFIEMKRRLTQALEENAQLRSALQTTRQKP